MRDGKVTLCQSCVGHGKVPIEGCPRRHIDADTADLMTAYDLLDRHGVLPVAGGWLDQTAISIAAMTVVASDIAWLEREQLKRNGRAR